MDLPDKGLPLEDGFVRHQYFLSIDKDTLNKLTPTELQEILLNAFGLAIILVSRIHKSDKGHIYYYYLDLPANND